MFLTKNISFRFTKAYSSTRYGHEGLNKYTSSRSRNRANESGYQQEKDTNRMSSRIYPHQTNPNTRGKQTHREIGRRVPWQEVPMTGNDQARPAAVAYKQAFNGALENQSMGVLSSYGVVTVLILNSALRLYTSTKFKKDGSEYDWVAPSLFHLLSGVCVISGAFTGVMFQLLNLYSKTALSMGNEAGYLSFKAATASFRKLGFYTFLLCLGTFTGTFVLSFYEKVKDDDRLGDTIFYFIGFLALLGIGLIKIILDAATAHIFTPEMGFQ